MGLKLAAAAREAAEETGIDPLRILRSLTREGGPGPEAWEFVTERTKRIAG